MYPHERSLVEKFKGRPFAILGVNSDESPAVAAAACTRERLTWKNFFDGGTTGGPIATKWGVEAWPTLYVIDHAGVIRVADGHFEDDQLDALIVAAEAAAKSPK